MRSNTLTIHLEPKLQDSLLKCRERKQINTDQKNHIKKYFFSKLHLLTDLFLMISYLDTSHLGSLLSQPLQILALQYNLMFYFPPPWFVLSDSLMNDIDVASYWVTKVRVQTHFYDSSKRLLCLFLENEESFCSCNFFPICTKNYFCSLLKKEITLLYTSYPCVTSDINKP